ncbi:DNA translocase FtsK [uncultured Jannaschia sp.]|uniref:DNA translocase FtsK n=1 Tax=uncultured Jannaschia sp. TaxID=293347 RepID=UPI00262D0573|nr:DNA translocase FtsK [uncultured Jannaschia sp.]
MAYPARQRDPLLDTRLQISLARRGREGLGVLMVVLGLLGAALLLSYHPDDPNWLAATDATPQNWLGMFGASLAAPLYLILGYGALGLPVALVVWGLRFALHGGSERVLPRAFFVPGWVLLLSLHCASLVPGPAWTHDFGLGGLFGDTGLGALLSILPIHAVLGLKLFTLVISAAAVFVGAWVLGFTREDLRTGGLFFLNGLGVAWHALRVATGSAAKGAARGTAKGAAALRERRAARAEDDEEAEDEAPTRSRWLSWLPMRRSTGPETPDEGTGGDGFDPDMPDDDRVRARIASAVRTRVRRASISQALAAQTDAPMERAEPTLTAATHRRVEEDPLVEDWSAADRPAVDRSVEDRAIETDADEPSGRPIRRTAMPDLETDPLLEDDEDDAVDDQHAPPLRHAIDRDGPAAPKPTPKRAIRATPAPAEDDDYEMPPLELLTDPGTVERHHLSDQALEENARQLEGVLEDYGVKGEIVSVRPGPVVTMYELEPAAGLKASRVIGLADDIARSMSALSARVSTVPGRSVIGIELPNEKREKVVLREILSAPNFEDTVQALPLALGKDIGGAPIVANLAKMPHLLIAGTTGSGKSVAINTMILSLLYKLSPDDCRMIMIDPKMLELSVYDGIPHLLSPVVTDPKKAVVALKWVVGEMEERYRKMSRMGVRNIEGYNGRVRDALSKGELFSRTVQTGFDDETGDPIFETEETVPEKLPYIVVIVDEMADLMMVAGKEIEACIQRLAQMARASGIHLVMATQRPSVDVITGTIKANFPTRISFHVTSKIDSRTILGEMGAEQLLGMGDMLYMAGGSKITRIHGPFCSDEEVEEIVNHLKAYGPPDYAASVLDGPDEDNASDIDAVLGLTGGNTGGEDALYDQAVAIVARDRKCSTSYIQRKLGIGYNKAARLVEQMEDNGAVTAANHVGKRDILLPDPNG